MTDEPPVDGSQSTDEKASPSGGKKWLKTAAIIVALIIVLLVVIGFFFNAIARKGVEKSLSFALQTEVTLGDLDLSLLGGKAELSDLAIGNPPGYDSDSAVRVKRARARINLKSFLSQVPIIYEITVEKPALTMEWADGRWNYQVLLQNAQRFSSDKEPAEEGPKKEGPTKTPRIDLLVIDDASASLIFMNERSTVSLPRIELKNLGGPKKSVAEIASTVLTALWRAVISVGGEEISRDVMRSLGKSLDAAADLARERTKGARERLGEKVEDLSEKAGEAAKEVKGVLRGLLKDE